MPKDPSPPTPSKDEVQGGEGEGDYQAARR